MTRASCRVGFGVVVVNNTVVRSDREARVHSATTCTDDIRNTSLTSGTNLQLDSDGNSTNSFGTYIQGTGNTGPININVSNLGFALTTGDTFTLSRTGNNLVLSFTPVPEPATVLAVGAAGLDLMSWVRRRRKPATV